MNNENTKDSTLNGSNNKEQELDRETFTPEIARKLEGYTDKFMCNVKDNTFKIKFLLFRVRDLESNQVLFEVETDETDLQDVEPVEDDEKRVIKYHLGPDFLDLTQLGSMLKFSVGDNSVKNFLMIEKHYFKNKLIKAFEFKFDFCIENSVNTWETMYTIPELSYKEKEEIISTPWETRSDSFYFVEDKLIMHHKALYNIF